MKPVNCVVNDLFGLFLLSECCAPPDVKLHESMLDSVVAARDKHLKADGLMLPSRATLYAAACRLPDFYADKIDFWSRVYGFDMSPIGEQALLAKSSKPEIAQIRAEDLLSAAVPVVDLDLAWIGLEDVQSVVSRRFSSIDSADATVYQGVCLWFDCHFNFPDGQREGDGAAVLLSTSPRAPPTHWKQTVIVLPSPVAVEEGDLIGWQLQLDQSAANRRQFSIELSLLDPESDEHPVPCACGRARCEVISAFLAKEDEQLAAESGAQVVDIS